jgi:Tubulin-tyrosine ligase family
LRENERPFTMKEHIVPKMKELINHSMNSIQKKVNPERRKYIFEVFGYDFMLDDFGRLYLIEVNTNPCLEESSPLLQMLIPRMISTRSFYS